MIVPPSYTPVQFIVPDDGYCSSLYHRWKTIYFTNQDIYSYVSHIYLARTYNLIYSLIKTDNLNLLNYPYTEVPISSAENIEFYKLNEYNELTLKEENNTLELINYAGTQEWYQNNQRHRDNDLPAVIRADGTQLWYKDGKPNRDNDLPAVIEADGTQSWYKNGELHRDNDLPAIIFNNGTQKWYKNGKLHRDNGLPALIGKDCRQYWFKHGVRYPNPY